MSSQGGGRAALGKLPGEPKKRPKATATLPAPTGGVALTRLAAKDVRTLMGKAAYPVNLDLSPSTYNLEDDTFLTNCTNVIKFLDLSANSLMELVSLGHLSKLKVLYAERNVLSHVSLRGLVGLELLSLKHNRVERLGDMGDLRKLVHLDLSNNHVLGGFDELEKLKSLRVLDLSFNGIDLNFASFHNLVVVFLRKLPHLEYLALEGNPVESTVPQFRAYIARELPKLRFLDWAPITREERSRSQKLEELGTWEAKNGPVSIQPGASASVQMQQQQPSLSPQQQHRSQRLSSTLDSLLSEIDQLGLGVDGSSSAGDAGPPPLRLMEQPDAPPPLAPVTGDIMPPPLRPAGTPRQPTAQAPTPAMTAELAAAEQSIDELISMFDASQPPPPSPLLAPATTGAPEQQQQQQQSSPALVVTPQSVVDEENTLLVDMMQQILDEGLGSTAPTSDSFQELMDGSSHVPDSEISPTVTVTISPVGTVSTAAQPEPEPEHKPVPEPATTAPAHPQAPQQHAPIVAASLDDILSDIVVKPPTEPAEAPVAEKKPAQPQQQQQQPRKPVAAAAAKPAAVPSSTKPAVAKPAATKKPAPTVSAATAAATATPGAPWKIFHKDLHMQLRLGEGSLGETHRAAPFRGKQVTVKKLRPQRFHPGFIHEFENDIKTYYALPTHPNVIHVLGASTEHVISFVCEQVEGKNLAEFADALGRRERLDARLKVAKGVAAAMQFLHGRGIVHGTLKPSDVIVGDDDSAHVRDYGFTKIKQVNFCEGALFAPQYIAPEFFSSNFEEIGPRGDVWSFGIMLWQLFEGSLTRGKLQEPAPQDGVPLKLMFEQTPNEIADVVTRCCAFDPQSRPDFAQVVAMLELLSPSQLRSYEAQVDQTTLEKQRKLHMIAEKIIDLFAAPSDYAPLKALAGIETLFKTEDNASAILTEKLHLHTIMALRSQYENVTEKAMRVLTLMCENPEFLRAIAKEIVPDSLLGMLVERNDVVTMLVLRLIATLMKSPEARTNFFSHNVLTHLLRQLGSANDLVLANAAWACSRLLKLNDARAPFIAYGGPAMMVRLLHGNNPAVQVHLLNALALLLSHEPAQKTIIEEGVANRFFLMLSSRSELILMQALKSVSRFSQSVKLLEHINVGEWVVAVQRHLMTSKNPAVLARACAALANLAHTDEERDRLESLGVLPTVIGFVAAPPQGEPQAGKRLQEQALGLLARLLSCDSCRDSFCDQGGLAPLAKIFLANGNNAKLQLACMRVFVELAADESALEAIAELGVVTPVVRQMAAAASRGDGERLLTALRLVRLLSQGPDAATEPIRQGGGVDKLLELASNCPAGIDARLVRFEAGMALAALLTNEQALPLVAAAPGGMARLFSLLDDYTLYELQEALLRQISILCRQEMRLIALFVRFGLLPHIAKLLVSPNIALQSLGLKIVVLVSQNKADIPALKASGVLSALTAISTKSPNPVLRNAAQKAAAVITN